MPSAGKLTEFVAWVKQHLKGDEKGEAQIFLDHLFQAFGWAGGLKEAGATLEMRVSRADGAGTAFAGLVWKPVALPSAARRDMCVENTAEQRASSGGATCPDAASSGAQSKTTHQGYKHCAPAGAAPPNIALAKDAIVKIDAVAAAAREVRRVRAEALPKLKGGLRALYRALELPGANPLKDTHAALDAAVLAAYGFSARKDLLAQLLALNLEVAAKIERGEPVTAPGAPKDYPNPKKLVTEDCIQPSPD